MSTENTQDQQDNGKVDKAFENNKAVLIGILKGNKDVLNGGIAFTKDELSEAIEELLKEKKEAAIVAIKVDITKLLDGHVAFDKFQREKEKEFKKAVLEKKKEFNKQYNDIVGRIKEFNQLSSDYYKSMNSVANQQEDEDVADTSDPNVMD